MSELVRANKVTVNVVENGIYKADFYRTHKHLLTITSEETEGFHVADGITKSGARELFRAYVVEHANEYGIDWNPADMRADGNIRKASYGTDEELIEDATNMLLPQMKSLVESCKYPIEWRGLSHEDISAMDKTVKGTDLSTLGITDGKYNKSGNWAWAYIGFTVIMGYKSEEIYMQVKMELVSGQLKKPKIGITIFNETVKNEIIDAGLATAEELDPPKESKQKSTNSSKSNANTDNVVKEEVSDNEPVSVEVEVPVEEPTEPKRRRSRKAKAEEE